jgi:hypothetical protein
MFSLIFENWRCVLVLLVVVVIALKTILQLDDTTIDKLIVFVAGGAGASAIEGTVRKVAATKAARAEETKVLPPEGPSTDPAKM